jgi:hypothetical protein
VHRTAVVVFVGEIKCHISYIVYADNVNMLGGGVHTVKKNGQLTAVCHERRDRTDS